MHPRKRKLLKLRAKQAKEAKAVTPVAPVEPVKRKTKKVSQHLLPKRKKQSQSKLNARGLGKLNNAKIG